MQTYKITAEMLFNNFAFIFQVKKSFLSELRREVAMTQQENIIAFPFAEVEPILKRNGADRLAELDGGAPIFEQLLLDLFRTEFHVKLLWGTGAGVQDFPHNFEVRHAKFAKVVSTLAAICTKH